MNDTNLALVCKKCNTSVVTEPDAEPNHYWCPNCQKYVHRGPYEINLSKDHIDSFYKNGYLAFTIDELYIVFNRCDCGCFD